MRSASILLLAACGNSEPSRSEPPTTSGTGSAPKIPGRVSTLKPRMASHEHAPVNSKLELALVFPRTVKEIAGHRMLMVSAEAGMSESAFLGKTALKNERSEIGKPTKDGDAVLLELSSAKMKHKVWYRSLGALGIECEAEDTPRNPTELARSSCFGTQLLADGLYVPFRIDRTSGLLSSDKETGVEIYLRVADGRTPDTIEKAASPFEIVERLTFDGGFGVVIHSAIENHEYQARVRRKLGSVDVLCDGDGRTEEAARAQMKWCLELEAI